eukprot:s5017_g1.t1
MSFSLLRIAIWVSKRAVLRTSVDGAPKPAAGGAVTLGAFATDGPAVGVPGKVGVAVTPPGFIDSNRSFAALASALAGPSVACLPSLMICESSPLATPCCDTQEASHALVLVELLDGQGGLDGQLEAAFARRWLDSASRRLSVLRHRTPAGQGRLADPILERQTSLGPGATMAALCRFFHAPPIGCWPEARLTTRRASATGPVPTEDPSSATLHAWTAATLHRADDEAFCTRGRPSYYGDSGDEGSGPLQLLPVFVGHDRSAHAERQALLRLLLGAEAAPGRLALSGSTVAPLAARPSQAGLVARHFRSIPSNEAAEMLKSGDWAYLDIRRVEEASCIVEFGSQLGLPVAGMNVRPVPLHRLQPTIPASTETFLRLSGSPAILIHHISRRLDGCGCGWSLRLSALGITALLSRRRALRLRTRSAAHVAWHFGCSRLGDADDAMEETLDTFLASFPDATRPGHFCHVSAPPQEPLPSRRKDGSNQPLLLDFGAQGPEPPVNLAFGLLFVPAKWVDRGPELLERLKQELRWPLGAPLLALPTEAATLQPGPKAVASMPQVWVAAVAEDEATFAEESVDFEASIPDDCLKLSMDFFTFRFLYGAAVLTSNIRGKTWLRKSPSRNADLERWNTAALLLLLRGSCFPAAVLQNHVPPSQDTIDENPLLSIQVYGGKVNGSMLSGRRFFGRESGDVGSALLFSESSRREV